MLTSLTTHGIATIISKSFRGLVMGNVGVVELLCRKLKFRISFIGHQSFRAPGLGSSPESSCSTTSVDDV